MNQLVILSGNGSTGKTSVAAALTHLASQEMRIVLADADADAANLELVLAPTKLEEHTFLYGCHGGDGSGPAVTDYQPEGAMARALQQVWAEIRKHLEA